MGKRRIIVPDASVMIPAFFQETGDYLGHSFNYTRRAKPLADAICLRKVTAIAPDLLFHEFAKVAVRKISEGFPSEVAEQQFQAFLRLAIRLEPARVPLAEGALVEGALAERAWDYMTNGRLAPADSWYVACAVIHDAELWISHEHTDGLVKNARAIHPKVYLLTEQTFG